MKTPDSTSSSIIASPQEIELSINASRETSVARRILTALLEKQGVARQADLDKIDHGSSNINVVRANINMQTSLACKIERGTYDDGETKEVYWITIKKGITATRAQINMAIQEALGENPEENPDQNTNNPQQKETTRLLTERELEKTLRALQKAIEKIRELKTELSDKNTKISELERKIESLQIQLITVQNQRAPLPQTVETQDQIKTETQDPLTKLKSLDQLKLFLDQLINEYLGTTDTPLSQAFAMMQKILSYETSELTSEEMAMILKEYRVTLMEHLSLEKKSTIHEETRFRLRGVLKSPDPINKGHSAYLITQNRKALDAKAAQADITRRVQEKEAFADYIENGVILSKTDMVATITGMFADAKDHGTDFTVEQAIGFKASIMALKTPSETSISARTRDSYIALLDMAIKRSSDGKIQPKHVKQLGNPSL